MFSAVVFLNSCRTSHDVVSNTTGETTVRENPERPVYQASATKAFDLIHTELRVWFDWENQRMPGTAVITLKPHFYPSRILELNAQSMTINEIKLVAGDSYSELGYSYDNHIISVELDRMYTRNDTIKILIDYISNPESLPKGGSVAITSDKGLYFINPLGDDPRKPRQVWTQGETTANSVWFPTIDHPNQKMTQEIYMTVDTNFVTLSNGTLISSIVNYNNGTRTDYWRQDLPHAPYLAMMAVGEYAVVKEKWHDKEVSYYVEPAYREYASKIFNHTPEMIDLFSRVLKVDYMWDKYTQVVVRDYVSGAMENTTATVMGEFVQKDARALLDGTNDDIVAHELFHQWFGDLVTCESYSNIPLNESFASYGEYIWNEYKYGRDEADYGLDNDLRTYISESRNKQVDLIRFDYNDVMEMFDRHSYQKGARILHMLRKYTGDEAFYASLNLYLTRNKFHAVEVHDLRLAFEEITGEDLNWFFNQWFLDKGHPSLKISYLFDETQNTETVTVSQTQNFAETPLYKLPVLIDIYTDHGVERHKVTIDKTEQSFQFKLDKKPYLVNFDAEKMLVCTKSDQHSREEFIAMYKRAPLYMDRYEALSEIIKDYKGDSPSGEVVMAALNDPHWRIRQMAIVNCTPLLVNSRNEVRQILIDLLKNDPKSDVRASALKKLTDVFKNDTEVNNVIETTALGDSSYNVFEDAVYNIVERDNKKGLEIVRQLESDNNPHIRSIVASVYTSYGSDEQYEYMTKILMEDTGYSADETVDSYTEYLMRCSPGKVQLGLKNLAEVAKTHAQWFVRLQAASGIAKIGNNYGKNDNLDRSDSGNPKNIVDELQSHNIEQVRKLAGRLLEEVKSQETDPKLKKIYNPE